MYPTDAISVYGFTQKVMAEKLNISVLTYRTYEQTGKNYRAPGLKMLVKTDRILEVSTDYLLGLEN